VVLGLAGVAFRLGIRVLEPHPHELRDFDYLYLKLARGFLWFWRNPSLALGGMVDAAGAKALRAVAALLGPAAPPARVNRVVLAAEKAAERGRDKNMRVSCGVPRVDVRSMESALFLVAVMLSLFLLYVAMGHLTQLSPLLPAALP
jgi:hypothetical protein